VNFNPSIYQEAIFEWTKKGTGSASVQAVAGSGKTTTVLKSIKMMQGSVFMTAFSSKIAEELKERLFADLIQNATAKTVHSFGKAALHRGIGNSELVNWKARKTVETILAGDKNDSMAFRTGLVHASRYAKLTMTDPSDVVAVFDLIDHFSLDIMEEELEPMLEFLPKVMKAMEENVREHDFDDMVWLPVKLGMAVPKHDWLLVDEAQDLNAMCRTLLLRSVRTGGRVMSVGDPYQSIFGFTGADIESMEKFALLTNATPLPLSICYRCPSRHVALARRIVPEIEAAPNAITGSIGIIHESSMLARVKNDDVILCRTNAPLASLAMDFLRRGVKVTIMGKEEIASGLKRLIEKYRGSDLDDCLNRLSRYAEKQCARLRAQDKDAQAELLRDRIETIHILADGLYTVAELISKIDTIFADTPGHGITLSTVHRAKGLEFENVFIMRPELIPFPFAKKDWEKTQEMNLKYVSLTRSKGGLYFVESEDMYKGSTEWKDWIAGA
jgi:DNA helicase-2/ATP-dependent DNA helicase PcrA